MYMYIEKPTITTSGDCVSTAMQSSMSMESSEKPATIEINRRNVYSV